MIIFKIWKWPVLYAITSKTYTLNLHPYCYYKKYIIGYLFLWLWIEPVNNLWKCPFMCSSWICVNVMILTSWKNCILKILNTNISHQFFFTINQPLAIQNTGTQIQKVVLYSKTGLKRSFKDSICFQIEKSTNYLYTYVLKYNKDIYSYIPYYLKFQVKTSHSQN